MRKIIWLTVFFIAVVSFKLSAETNYGAPSSGKAKGELVSMDSSRARLNQLERRMSELEREVRYQRDSIRSVEREVNDLHRRRD